jgi:hypothetical protein
MYCRTTSPPSPTLIKRQHSIYSTATRSKSLHLQECNVNPMVSDDNPLLKWQPCIVCPPHLENAVLLMVSSSSPSLHFSVLSSKIEVSEAQPPGGGTARGGRGQQAVGGGDGSPWVGGGQPDWKCGRNYTRVSLEFVP